MAHDGTGRTFSEVHGYDQLPEPLKLEDVPETARVQNMERDLPACGSKAIRI